MKIHVFKGGRGAGGRYFGIFLDASGGLEGAWKLFGNWKL